MHKGEHFWSAGFACTVVLVAALCNTPYSQHNTDDPEWSLPVYEEGCGALMKALHEEWIAADGELTFDVARKLFWALLLDPDAYYAEFSSDTVYYHRFSRRMDALVFWNPNDTTTAYLERLRIVAIERLVDQAYTIETKHMHLHEEMIEALRRVKVSHVY